MLTHCWEERTHKEVYSWVIKHERQENAQPAAWYLTQMIVPLQLLYCLNPHLISSRANQPKKKFHIQPYLFLHATASRSCSKRCKHFIQNNHCISWVVQRWKEEQNTSTGQYFSSVIWYFFQEELLGWKSDSGIRFDKKALVIRKRLNS